MKFIAAEKYLYSGLIFGCLISFPFSTPYIDLLFIGFYVLLQLRRNIQNLGISKSILFQNFLVILLFAYFAFRDLFSMSQVPDLKTLRILLVHLLLLSFVLIVGELEGAKIGYRVILNIGICYFFLYNAYFFLIWVIGQNWAELQTVYLTGSLYVAIPFIFISFLILENSSSKTFHSECLLTSLAILSAIVYSSRTLLLFVLFFATQYLYKSRVELEKRLRFVFGFWFISIIFSLVFGVFVSHSNDVQVTPSTSQSAVSQSSLRSSDISVSHYFKDITSSIFFLIKNRNSDSDRKEHISCAFEALENRNAQSKLFGSGTNTYRYTLGSCTQFGGGGYSDEKIVRQGRGSQSISFTVIMLDYGLFPYLLLFSIFVYRLYQFSRKQTSFTYIIYFLLNFYLFFVTNLGAAFIVWLFFASRRIIKPINQRA